MPRLRTISFLAASLVAATAIAAPRVGVVVVTHEGISDQQADEIAFDIAGAVAEQIEGEALAGPSVRQKLTEPLAAGCEQDARCGRKVAGQIGTDEVLFLVLKKGSAKKDVDVVCHRVARDPDRVPTDGEIHLAGNAARRSGATADTVKTIYPKGSVVPYVEPPAADPMLAKMVAETPPPPPPPPADSITTKKWFWPVVGVGAAVVVAAVVVGLVVGLQPQPTAPSITLP